MPSIGNIEEAENFQLSRQNFPFLKELKISAILLKYSIFRVFFLSFHGQKKYKNMLLDIAIFTLKSCILGMIEKKGQSLL